VKAIVSGGAGMIVLYTGLIAMADAITRDLSYLYAAPQMYAVSGFVVISLCLLAPQMKPTRSSLKTSRPLAMGVRSGATVLATICFFLAFRHLPFAQVFLFIGLMPLFAALLAGPILKETVSSVSWIGLAIGFLGVLCLFPQGLGEISFGHLAAFLAAIFGTVSIVISRYIARYDTGTLAQVFFPNLALFIVMGSAAPFFWQPMPISDLVLAAIYGVVLFVARCLLVIALRDLAAHAATSLMKLQFVWMVMIGAAMFGEWPSANTYLGATIIIGSGLLLVYEDQFRRVPVRA